MRNGADIRTPVAKVFFGPVWPLDVVRSHASYAQNAEVRTRLYYQFMEETARTEI